MAGPQAPAVSMAWLTAAPIRRAKALTARPTILQRLAPQGPMLALGLLALLVLAWYVQVVQLSLTQGSALREAWQTADLERVAQADVAREALRLTPRTR